MRVLMIGPSPYKSKGGMATVIKGLIDDHELNSKIEIGIHESYIDGNIIQRVLFSIYAFILFLFKYKKYDIFHIHVACYGSTFRKGLYVHFLNKKRKKIIFHVHGAEYLLFYNNLPKWKKKIVHEIWNRCDVIIALSKQWKAAFEEIFDKQNIIVINNGINIENFIEGRNDVKSHTNNYLFLGRLGNRKGAWDIVDAVKQLKTTNPNIKVFMAGDGDVEQFRKKVRALELDKQISIEGWSDFDKKIELMKKTTTLLLPSYNEGLPMSILEGMAAGKVIICTNVGGIPEVVKNNENGIVIEPGNVTALADAMKFINDNPEFAYKCSYHNIFQVEENFSIKKMHKKILNIYFNILR